MTKRKKLFICFIISLFVVSFQFTIDRLEHMRLASNGIIVSAGSNYFKSWTGDYAHFVFTTIDGRQIEHTEKCGSKQSFDKGFVNMKVIYNKMDPNEFMNLYDFANYSLTYRIFFYFGIYLAFLTFFLFLLQRNIGGLYKFFKSGLHKVK